MDLGPFPGFSQAKQLLTSEAPPPLPGTRPTTTPAVPRAAPPRPAPPRGRGRARGRGRRAQGARSAAPAKAPSRPARAPGAPEHGGAAGGPRAAPAGRGPAARLARPGPRAPPAAQPAGAAAGQQPLHRDRRELLQVQRRRHEAPEPPERLAPQPAGGRARGAAAAAPRPPRAAPPRRPARAAARRRPRAQAQAAQHRLPPGPPARALREAQAAERLRAHLRHVWHRRHGDRDRAVLGALLQGVHVFSGPEMPYQPVNRHPAGLDHRLPHAGSAALRDRQRGRRLADRHDLRAHPVHQPGDAGLRHPPHPRGVQIFLDGPAGLLLHPLAGRGRRGHHPLHPHVPAPLPDRPRHAAAQQALHRRLLPQHRRPQQDQLQHPLRHEDPHDHLPRHRAAGLQHLPVDHRRLDGPRVREVPRPAGCDQQLPGCHVAHLHHLPLHRLRRHGASHLLWERRLPPHRHHGGWLHRPGGGRGGQETGTHQSREARAQLHDGHAADEADQECGSQRPAGNLAHLQTHQAAEEDRSCQSQEAPEEVPTSHSPAAQCQDGAEETERPGQHAGRPFQDAERHVRPDRRAQRPERGLGEADRQPGVQTGAAHHEFQLSAPAHRRNPAPPAAAAPRGPPRDSWHQSGGGHPPDAPVGQSTWGQLHLLPHPLHQFQQLLKCG